MIAKTKIEELVAEVLDGTELRLKVDAYELTENLEDGEVRIHCEVHDQRTGERHTIAGKGVGIVDAFFRGLVSQYSDQYPSLESIRFADFSIAANVETGRGAARTDMAAEVTVRVANSEGHEISFLHSSPSITRSSIYVVLMAVEFFANSERAFIALYKALEHAKEENRADSVARYTRQMSTLVGATSYSEVTERIRKAALDR